MPREGTFLIKQKAFIKVYLLSQIEKGRSYGLQLQDDLYAAFRSFGLEPNHSEIYRSLHELTEEGYLTRRKVRKEGAKYQEIAVYTIKDPEKAKAYKAQAKMDLERGVGLLQKALHDNFW